MEDTFRMTPGEYARLAEVYRPGNFVYFCGRYSDRVIDSRIPVLGEMYVDIDGTLVVANGTEEGRRLILKPKKKRVVQDITFRWKDERVPLEGEWIAYILGSSPDDLRYQKVNCGWSTSKDIYERIITEREVGE